MSSSANVVPCTRGAGAGGRDGLRRKAHRSLYLPSLAGRPPGLSTTTPPQGRASLDTINAATMRPCRGEPPALARSIAAGSRSHSKPAGAGGRDGLRRKAHRSLYLPWLAGRPPGLSTITPPQGRASLDTINAATMRPCGVDHPAAGRACVLLRSRLGVTALQSRPPCRSPPSAAGRLPLISRPMATLRLMTQILPSPHRGARAGTP